jgi:hypothetical protein
MVNIAIPIIFIVGMIIVTLLSLTGRIHLSLLFLVPLFPLRNVVEKMHQFPMGKDMVDIILIAMIIGWFFRAVSRDEKIVEYTPFNKLLVVMIIFTYFAAWKGSFYLGVPSPISFGSGILQNWKNYMIFPLLFFITVNNIKSIKQMKWLILFIVFSMFLMNYYTINQIRWMSGIISRTKINGTFMTLGPNEIAAFYAMYTFVLVGIVLCFRAKLWRLQLMAVILMNSFCILFLYSRGAYLALLSGLAFISFMKNKGLFIAIILLLLSWKVILPPDVIERINETQTEEGELDNSSKYRLELWEEGINMFKKAPLIGVGLSVIAGGGIAIHDGEIVFGDTHNIYIKILAEQGIVGIMILLILLWLAFRSGWQLYKTSDDDFMKGLGLGFLGCVIAVVVSNVFGDRWTHHQVGAYFWVFLGLVVRGNIILEEQQELLECEA